MHNTSDDNDRCPAPPSSPTLQPDCEHITFIADHIADRITVRRRGNSLSRVRDEIRRKGASLQEKLERKLLERAELHFDVPLPLAGPRGLMFHVPEMPGQHSRDSVVLVLNQSIDWLRENPNQGESPYSFFRCQDEDGIIDLLGQNVHPIHFPPLTPSNPNAPFRGSVICPDPDFSYTRPRVREGPVSRFQSPTYSTALASHPVYVEQTNSIPEAFDLSYPPLKPALSVNHDHVDYAVHELEAISNERTDLDTAILLHSSPRTPSPICRKPIPPQLDPSPIAKTKSWIPTTLLGVGLRPIPAPTITRVIQPKATQDIARAGNHTTITNDLYNQGKDHKAPTRKHCDNSLRALNNLQHQPTREPTPNSPREHITYSRKVPGKNKITDRIHQFESSSSSESSSNDYISRSPKRRAVYGFPSVTYRLSLEIKDVITDNIGVPEASTKSGAYEYKPYRPTPTPMMPTSSNIRSPYLPSVPHLKGYIVREFELQLSPDLPGDQLAEEYTALNSARSSATKNGTESNTEMDIPCDDQHSSLHGKSEVPCVAYSGSIVRKGTLRQLGGRVVEVRKRFEMKTNKINEIAKVEVTTDPPHLHTRQQARPGYGDINNESFHHAIPFFYKHVTVYVNDHDEQRSSMHASKRITTSTSTSTSPKPKPTHNRTASESSIILQGPPTIPPRRYRISQSAVTQEDGDRSASHRHGMLISKPGHGFIRNQWERRRFEDQEWHMKERLR